MAAITDPTEAKAPVAPDFPGAGAPVGSFITGDAASADFGVADGVTAASKTQQNGSEKFQIGINKLINTNRELFKEEIVPGEEAGEIDTAKLQKENTDFTQSDHLIYLRICVVIKQKLIDRLEGIIRLTFTVRSSGSGDFASSREREGFSDVEHDA